MSKKGIYPAALAKYYNDHPEKYSVHSRIGRENPERIKRQSDIARRVLHSPEIQKKSELSRKHHPRLVAGPSHHSGKRYCLRDPRGQLWEFVNLREFVRTHTDLFDHEDVIWKKCGRHHYCRALALHNLVPFGKRKRPFSHWKEWTWHSREEQVSNNGRDLLDRISVVETR